MHRIVSIANVKKETDKIYTLRFADSASDNAIAGQFLMIWLPGIDEVPMSLSYVGKLKGITVNDIGDATHALCNFNTSDRMGVRGPFGKGFDLSSKNIEKILAVGGGTGMAPLAMAIESAAKSKIKVITLIGARTRSELLFVDRMKKSSDVRIATDDGSAGHHGFVTDIAHDLLKDTKLDLIITCGPEIMIKKIFDFGEKYSVPVQASVERYMKCGVGICDACAIGNFQVCKDGPVFNSVQLKGTEFGKFSRDSSGRKVWLRGMK